MSDYSFGTFADGDILMISSRTVKISFSYFYFTVHESKLLQKSVIWPIKKLKIRKHVKWILEYSMFCLDRSLEVRSSLQKIILRKSSHNDSGNGLNYYRYIFGLLV